MNSILSCSTLGDHPHFTATNQDTGISTRLMNLGLAYQHPFLLFPITSIMHTPTGMGRGRYRASRLSLDFSQICVQVCMYLHPTACLGFLCPHCAARSRRESFPLRKEWPPVMSRFYWLRCRSPCDGTAAGNIRTGEHSCFIRTGRFKTFICRRAAFTSKRLVAII